MGMCYWLTAGCSIKAHDVLSLLAATSTAALFMMVKLVPEPSTAL